MSIRVIKFHVKSAVNSPWFQETLCSHSVQMLPPQHPVNQALSDSFDLVPLSCVFFEKVLETTAFSYVHSHVGSPLVTSRLENLKHVRQWGRDWKPSSCCLQAQAQTSDEVTAGTIKKEGWMHPVRGAGHCCKARDMLVVSLQMKEAHPVWYILYAANISREGRCGPRALLGVGGVSHRNWESFTICDLLSTWRFQLIFSWLCQVRNHLVPFFLTGIRTIRNYPFNHEDVNHEGAP